MGDRPRSLPEFEARFPDDAACARWLLAKRWPDGFRCPACGHDRAWELGRGLLVLQCAACERQTSVTAGTVLHGSHLPLRTWFLAAWLMAAHRNGISARQLGLQPARAGQRQDRVAAVRQAPAGHGRSRTRASARLGRGRREHALLSFGPRTTRSAPGPAARAKAGSSSPARSRSRAAPRGGCGSR